MKSKLHIGQSMLSAVMKACAKDYGSAGSTAFYWDDSGKHSREFVL